MPRKFKFCIHCRRTITESEYFRTLEQKARELRQRRASFPNPRPVPPEAKS